MTLEQVRSKKKAEIINRLIGNFTSNYHGGDTIIIHNRLTTNNFGVPVHEFLLDTADIDFITNENVLDAFAGYGWEVKISFQLNLLDTIFTFKSIHSE